MSEKEIQYDEKMVKLPKALLKVVLLFTAVASAGFLFALMSLFSINNMNASVMSTFSMSMPELAALWPAKTLTAAALWLFIPVLILIVLTACLLRQKKNVVKLARSFSMVGVVSSLYGMVYGLGFVSLISKINPAVPAVAPRVTLIVFGLLLVAVFVYTATMLGKEEIWASATEHDNKARLLDNSSVWFLSIIVLALCLSVHSVIALPYTKILFKGFKSFYDQIIVVMTSTGNLEAMTPYIEQITSTFSPIARLYSTFVLINLALSIIVLVDFIVFYHKKPIAPLSAAVLYLVAMAVMIVVFTLKSNTALMQLGANAADFAQLTGALTSLKGSLLAEAGINILFVITMFVFGLRKKTKS